MSAKRKLSAGGRTIWLIAGVAVVFLAVGFALSQFVVSPGEAARRAAPPTAGPITVPVEERKLSNVVTIRADATYDDPVEVSVETSDLSGPAVVTGQVPKVGSRVKAASVVLQITGRPVIVLSGGLPAYRTLRAGESGPDVKQLKKALKALGLNPGSTKSDVYDAATAAAVEALYGKVGYSPPSAGTEATESVKAAEEGVRAAQDAADQAAADLDKARRQGASASQIVEADNAVNKAGRELADAKAGKEAACGSVADCSDALRLAQAQRQELNKAPDTTAEQNAVNSAAKDLAAARKTLTDAQTGALTPLPASEVVYLDKLPRRVDEVSVRRGSTVSGAFMTVSGATLQLVGTASKNDAELLKKGQKASITLPDSGDRVSAVIASVKAPSGSAKNADSGDEGGSGSSGRYRVVLNPVKLSDAQMTELQGQNVKVVVPVSSTGGQVMAVPLAALTMGPGGESRVEVLGTQGSTMVTVETGLSAGGYAEVTPTEKDALKVGDQVVVGR